MTLQELYLYFSQFVPLDVLKRNHVSSATADTSAEALQQDVLSTESDERIETIGDYLFLGDQDFVLERLRNSHQQLLFVDSDRLMYKPFSDTGSNMSIGLTVAEHYNQSNASVVSELVVQDRCLETLQRILRRVISDSGEVCQWDVSQPVEIRFFDMKALNGLIGYTAFFSITTSEYRG